MSRRTAELNVPPAELLESARRTSRQSAGLAMLSAVLVAVALLLGVWRIRHAAVESKQHAAALVIASAQLEATQRRNTRVVDYLEGRTTSVTLGSTPAWVDSLVPVVHYEASRWRYKFHFSVPVPDEHKGELKKVAYSLDRSEYDDAPLPGAGSDYAADVEVAVCRSNATVSLELV
ncbi:MAG TPA: hypothetical protein VGI10_24110, partial [Polyangiaceae bacterium]